MTCSGSNSVTGRRRGRGTEGADRVGDNAYRRVPHTYCCTPCHSVPDLGKPGEGTPCILFSKPMGRRFIFRFPHRKGVLLWGHLKGIGVITSDASGAGNVRWLLPCSLLTSVLWGPHKASRASSSAGRPQRCPGPTAGLTSSPHASRTSCEWEQPYHQHADACLLYHFCFSGLASSSHGEEV